MRETELLYSFDSPVAEGLQACYDGLAKLGQPVVDLKIWHKTPSPAPSVSPTPAAEPPKLPPDAGLLMRLHPGPSEPPGRAVVSPVGDDRNLQVLTAPEKLVQALQAAADPARPPAERVTFVRCAASRGALKVIAVGIGQHAEERNAPARWENVSPWFEAAKKTPQAVAAPAASTKEPELF